MKSLEETVDGKLENYATVTIADEKISAAVKSLEETVDGKLENYATVTIADEKISAAVKSLEETVDGKLENYATVSIADEKISTAVSTAKTEIENGIATTLESYSTIDQTSESISAAVTGFVDGETLSSEITAALGELSLSASSANGTATLTLKDGNTELSSKSFTLNVDAVNISGTLDAHFVSLDGLLELKNGEARGYVGANNAKGGAVLASENTSVYVIANNTTAKMSSFEEHMIWVHTSGCFSTDTIQISSDRTLKDNINYDLSDEEKLFEKLQPCSFSYISDKSTKKHWGFIAQDFIASAHYLDMDTDKLAVLGEYEGKYSIGYGEITALNTYMIQKLMRRVAALESRLEE